MLKTVEDILTALGGLKPVSEMTGIGITGVHNWKARGRIPAEHYFRISEALKAGGHPEADQAVFGFAPTIAAE